MLESMIYTILRTIAFNNELYKIAFIFDNIISFDIIDGLLVLTFNKSFFKTFKNNILSNKNDILKIKTNESFYYESKIEFFSYKIKESILYDSNNIHITLLDSKVYKNCIESLKVLSNVLYNNYNYKGLNYNDKKLLYKIGGHFKVVTNLSKNDILIKINNEKNYYSNDLIIDSKDNNKESVIAYDSYIIDKYNSKEYDYNSYRYYTTFDYVIDYNRLMSYLFFKFNDFCLNNKNFKTIVFKDSIFIYFKHKAIFSFKIDNKYYNSIVIKIYSKNLKKYDSFIDLLELYIDISLLKDIDNIEKINFYIH